jgi:molybdopterin/thiamine biosynthesis adenylyltransferase/proteasome lid subunit RPN8/RPN11
MKYTLTLLDADLKEIRALAFSTPGIEGAAFALCSSSKTDSEHRLLVRSIVAVEEDEYLVRKPDFLSIDSKAYVRATQKAKAENLSVVFIHSHPGGLLMYSAQDDREEPKLQEFFNARIPALVHGSLVLTDTGVVGRIWLDGEFKALSRIRVIGRRFAFHDAVRDTGFLEYFDRQVRAFGPEVQAILKSLHIGVIGAGGTGSALVEQLVRLGVGEISVFDGDTFDDSNVNRVYGSSTKDKGRLKVDIAKDSSDRISLGTVIHPVPTHITSLDAALKLRDCDIVFGCTDKEAPRGLLVQLALRYLIPLIDMGVVIDSIDGEIRDVVGRVTTFFPGEACLFCRGRITADAIRYEGMTSEEREIRIAEGYAPELGTPNPAVIPFTSVVASLAVAELLHRLTGFMGSNRESTEVMCFFDKQKSVTNRERPAEECLCSRRAIWARGDYKLFLGTMWGASTT